MLVLARSVNEGIHIGHDIRIVVTGIRGDRVMLGIEAPKEVAVHRDEVYAAIERQQLGKEAGA
jgi:carbon storage regulator